MHHINGAYTNYFNVNEKDPVICFKADTGHCWQILMKYAQELSRYIHLNPVKAGMVEKPEQYKWSSYRDYINVNKSSKWLCTNFILSLFSRKTSVAKKQYRRFVESMADVDYESPFKDVFASTILGGRSFITK